jgi:hypothetical protein
MGGSASGIGGGGRGFSGNQPEIGGTAWELLAQVQESVAEPNSGRFGTGDIRLARQRPGRQFGRRGFDLDARRFTVNFSGTK